MSKIAIQPEDFDSGVEIAALSQGRSDVGAVASFVGVVRGDDGLTALTLEHYPAMTHGEIAKIVAEAEQRWPLKGVTVIHRIGRLPVGAQVVLVAVASGHRGAAFEACEFLMDYLKTRAPFWKQEERGDKTGWVDAKSSDDEQAARWNT
ncbi:MAG TPA: molybdenum cofactor biosynthesis protein MoaE [Rhizomicrobium sp.]|jgi:molybdopterin synthase catalytic subunit|nr:molybdenum cofactor biosynthesis protein MoaE [Rhizomicrobium sp.]